MRFVFRFLGMLLLSAAVAGCSNKEPEQRAAFIVWLQTRVMEAPERHVPTLDEAERDLLGDYVDQYEILYDIDELIDAQMQHLASAFEHEALTSLAQLQARRDALRSDRQALADGHEALHQAVAHARAEQAQWQLPADLQPLYAAAYERIVTQRVAKLDALSGTALASLDDALRVVDFIEVHADQVSISAAASAVRDPSVQRELNALLDRFNSHAVAVEQAQQDLQALQRL